MTSPSDNTLVARLRKQVLHLRAEPSESTFYSTADHATIDELEEAATALEASYAENERLTAERDEARANEDDGLAWEALRLCKIRAERAEAALRPFVIGDAAMEQILWGHLPDDATGTITVKLGDFRRARTALKDSPK